MKLPLNLLKSYNQKVTAGNNKTTYHMTDMYETKDVKHFNLKHMKKTSGAHGVCDH